MTIAEAPGLRERKRIATRRAIQLAALRLATDRGLEHVTIEEISRVADVSPRTFFNYFDSKDAAISGDQPEFHDSDAVRRFIHAGPNEDVIKGIGTLLADSADDLREDHETLLLRRALHRQQPQLFSLKIAGMRLFEEQLKTIVALRLANDDPALAKDSAALDSRARLMTLVAFAAMRHAWTCWADTESAGEPLSKRLHESFQELDDLLLATARSGSNFIG